MKPQISIRTGSYNLLEPSEKSVQICVRGLPPECTEKGGIAQTWDIGEEPDIDELPPSEVIALINEKTQSHWIDTSKKDHQAVADWAKANAATLDASWAKAEIETINQKIKRLEARRDELKDYESSSH